jgi:hypothetical protein
VKKAGTHLAAVALFLALSGAMLWPLPRLMDRASAHPADPCINTWTYDWVWHAMTHRGVSLFNANAMHPDGPSLAFIEHQFGIAMVGFPFRAAGVPPHFVHNILILLGFAFSGYGAFVLAKMVTGSWWAAACSGIYFAFLPWRFTHLTQTQHLWAGWLPLMLAALIAFARKPTVARAAVFGAAFYMNGLTNMHWMAFGSLAMAVTALLFLIRKPRALLLCGAATAVATLLLLPLLLPYREVRQRYDFRGDVDETRRYSALPGDWLSPNFHTRLHMKMNANDGTTDPERWLFPGVGGVLLALLGLIGPIGGEKHIRRLVLITGLLWILIGFLFSLGVNAPFHRFLFDHVALYNGIRTPARWAMIAYTGLALLAAVGTVKLCRWRAAGPIVAALLLFELRAAPLQWHYSETDPAPVYEWLANEKDRGAVLELPIRRSGTEYQYLLHATIHHRKLVNGITGAVMPVHEEIVRAFEQRPIDLGVVDRLTDIGVTRIVVHGDVLGEETAAVRNFLFRATENGKLKYVARFDRGVEGDYVFAPGRGDARPFFGPQPLSRPIGWLDEPQAGAEVRGSVRVMGWALAPAGIRHVRVYVNNGARRFEAQLFARPDVGALYPWHDASRAGFTVDIPRDDREGGTDVEVEITDARGEVVRLPQRWFVWSK